MANRFFRFATLLSLLLSLASAFMWVRSLVVVERWTFKPRPAANSFAGEGWHKHRAVESGGGRVAYVKYDAFIRAGTPPPVGYDWFAEPLSPVRVDRRLPNYPLPHIPPPELHGSIPGVAEWCVMPHFWWVGRSEFIAVSWLMFVAAGAVLPTISAVGRWRRRRRRDGPAFPLAPAGVTDAQRQPS